MGITEVLTVIFIVLKLTGVITWSWWLVLLPEIIAFVIYAIIIAINLFVVIGLKVELKRFWKEMNREFFDDDYFKNREG